MRFLHHAVGALLVIQAALLGGWMLGAAAGGGASVRRFGLTVDGAARLDGMGFGLALLMLAALYALTAVPRRRRALSFDNEGGTVSISTDAIGDYVARLAPEFPAVTQLVPTVVARRKSIDISVGVRVKTGPQIQEVCELLQQRIRESLATGLGVSQVRRVTVRVMDIVPEQKDL